MPCAPASPRRYQVPGPDSEKLVTEDSTGVRTQAPVPVKATSATITKNTKSSDNQRVPKSQENQKYVQQIFHKNMFFARERSASTSDLSNLKKITNPNKDDNPDLDDTKNLKIPWQREPNQKNKRNRSPDEQMPTSKMAKKIFDSAKTSNATRCNTEFQIETSNRYSQLQVDIDSETSSEQINKKVSKPPPIILYGIDDVK